MTIYEYEGAFGAWDKTSGPMRRAIRDWFSLYYGAQDTPDTDPCQRVAYSVVNKLVKTVFGEYRAQCDGPFYDGALRELNRQAAHAVQLAMVGGACYIKPCIEKEGFSFRVIGRDQALIFGRNEQGEPTDMGTVERSTQGKFYYTLLERRYLDETGCLVLENKLFRSLSGQSLGTQVPLASHPAYGRLPLRYRYPIPMGGIGLVQMRTPMLNCVDSSDEGVSVFAPATALIRNIDRNEAQMNGEFSRGESRILASADLLRDGKLDSHLFVGLDDDPEQVGITVFSPKLREESYLARKQEYLRNVESIVGLKRGMLSNADNDLRTATEISSSAGDYNLTVMEFQRMWEQALQKTMALCGHLAQLYRLTAIKQVPQVQVDWGNGILYDEEKTWQDYRQMVLDGLIRPEIALGWRFGLPAGTEEEQAAIRQNWMPAKASPGENKPWRA